MCTTLFITIFSCFYSYQKGFRLFATHFSNFTFKNKKNIMKKFASLLLIAAVIGLMGSCKPKEKCPAYGKAFNKSKHIHS